MKAKKSRILMISTHGYVGAEPEFGKPDTGGQVVYVLELSKSLARLGFQVDIYTRRFERQPRMEKVTDRVQVIRVPCGGKEFIPKETLYEHIPEWCENTLAYIKQRKISYEFINSHYWDAGLAGQTLSGRLGIAHLHTPHSIGAWKRDNMDGDPEELERTYNFKTRIRREKEIYDSCDALIATTPQQRDILLKSEYDVPDDKIYVLPPGYDDTRFYPVSLATRDALKRQYGYEGRLVLTLGRMARNKGYDLLIQSMKVVCERLDDVMLLLAAGSQDPPPSEIAMLEELKQTARDAGVYDRVLFHDYIPDDDLPAHYQLADVFALSSRYEPFGMTAVEAMACGTPTVITTEGGLWEQVRYGTEALYANPYDPEAFGHALHAVLKYPRLSATLQQHGSQKARASFTWMGIAQRLLSVIQGFRVTTARSHP